MNIVNTKYLQELSKNEIKDLANKSYFCKTGYSTLAEPYNPVNGSHPVPLERATQST